MADLLAAAAAFSDLPQAWQAPRKRLPAAARRAFAGRLKDRLVLPALKQALQPRAERCFTCDTYAGLPGRDGHRAA